MNLRAGYRAPSKHHLVQLFDIDDEPCVLCYFVIQGSCGAVVNFRLPVKAAAARMSGDLRNSINDAYGRYPVRAACPLCTSPEGNTRRLGALCFGDTDSGLCRQLCLNRLPQGNVQALLDQRSAPTLDQ